MLNFKLTREETQTLLDKDFVLINREGTNYVVTYDVEYDSYLVSQVVLFDTLELDA